MDKKTKKIVANPERGNRGDFERLSITMPPDMIEALQDRALNDFAMSAGKIAEVDVVFAKDKLLSIGLYQRERDVILRNPEQVMLVAIDPKDRVVAVEKSLSGQPPVIITPAIAAARQARYQAALGDI